VNTELLKDILLGAGPYITIGLVVFFLVQQLNRAWAARLAEAVKYAQQVEALYRQSLRVIGDHTKAMNHFTQRIELLVRPVADEPG